MLKGFLSALLTTARKHGLMLRSIAAPEPLIHDKPYTPITLYALYAIDCYLLQGIARNKEEDRNAPPKYSFD
jgi:hypothetical protein